MSDVPELTDLMQANREFLEPWEPVRPPEYFTEPAVRAVTAGLVDARNAGLTMPFVIDDDGSIAGRTTLNNIVRGPFQSASIGYWVDGARGGRGIASEACRLIVEYAFGEFGLHRVEAGTLVDNLRSQKVLANNGFEQFGMAPRYLQIAGQWQDHLLFQRINQSY
ncbi:N-acetyltransferase [Nocardioides marmorisolisilvae]|uniref:N-acetyltransferase n=2 Tax=Nocardioides marmorisolisilvae TaxID=1542737 RepID=A0A3N0DIF5_9ACTN|nr:N-acetyltransferase [Nocardioides marmorisolisilvae]